MHIFDDHSFRGKIPVALVALLLHACEGGDGTGGQPGGNGPPQVVFDPLFSAIQENVFTPTCATAGCHAGAGAPQGLRLDAANSYGLLVGVPSAELPSLQRVDPGNPDGSYLLQKLDGSAAAGARMPLGAAPLAPETIGVIRQWITDGAMDDRATSAAPLRVVSLLPDPGSELANPPGEIVAMFDRPADVSTINGATFLLQAAGGDGSFDDGNETAVVASAVTASASGMVATYELAATALADDSYRVRLLGEGPSLIMDLDANALDGEFAGSLPSGDGVGGGNFEARFTLTTGAGPGSTLAAIQAGVFGPSCSSAGCHSGPAGGSLPAGMDLSDAAASFQSLVGVASSQQAALLRVAPGDPDASYLLQKIEGRAASGARMPLGGPPLAPELVDAIRQWIGDGAPARQ